MFLFFFSIEQGEMCAPEKSGKSQKFCAPEFCTPSSFEHQICPGLKLGSKTKKDRYINDKKSFKLLYSIFPSEKICGKVKHKLRVASYEFTYTSYEFKYTSCEFKSTSYEFKSTSFEFYTTSCEFESTSYEFKSTSYQFKSTS